MLTYSRFEQLHLASSAKLGLLLMAAVPVPMHIAQVRRQLAPSRTKLAVALMSFAPTAVWTIQPVLSCWVTDPSWGSSRVGTQLQVWIAQPWGKASLVKGQQLWLV